MKICIRKSILTTSMFCSWTTSLRQKLMANQQRCLVVLNGDLAWANALVESLINHENTDAPSVKVTVENTAKNTEMIAYGAEFNADSDLIINNYRHHLGTENDYVFFADDDFHPDAFAALSGTIKAGGIMFWLCSPELKNNKNNLFIQRLWQQVINDENSFILTPEDQTFPELNLLFGLLVDSSQTAVIESFIHPSCRTREQLVAVEAIEKVAKGHRKRPLVLTADRGRGKSSALAIAVANLMSEPQTNALSIVITAPHRDAVNVFFMQLQHSCVNGLYSTDSFTYKNHLVKFVPVDVLALEQPEAHLLLIDEAAAIPIYLLSHLLAHYHRMVFSSTVHGYEGAGRGFAINFKKILAETRPQFAQLHLHQPIRWCENDPLEQLVFNSFLLAPVNEIPTALTKDQNNDNLSVNQNIIKKVSQQQLFENEILLRQVFSVLVTAHYQTSPSDLKFLLTNAELSIFVSFSSDDKTVLAVALALNESNASAADIQLALASKKRLKDQFLPQSLLLHCGVKTAFEYQYLRIVRIAVLPELHGGGIGSNLLAFVETYAKQNQYDFVGTSFGANKRLVNFWGKAEYQFARIGFTQDKASGEHSCLLLKSLSQSTSESANNLLLAINQQFYQHFYYYLAEQFQHISPELVQTVYQQANPELLAQLSQDDLNMVKDFINRVSLYDVCAYSLSVWLCHVLAHTTTINIELLIAKVLQRRSISDLCRQYQLTGKKALNNALISQVKAIYKF